MEKTLLLIDVDGPLNPYAGKPSRRPDGYDTHRVVPQRWTGKPLRLWLNKGHGPMLIEFALENNLELAWATTWEHEANTIIGPKIGLKEKWPVIEFKEHWHLKTWKFSAVANFATGRPLIWLDDDFKRYTKEQISFLQQRGNVPTLLHHVSPSIGMIPEDLVTIKKWLVTVCHYAKN